MISRRSSINQTCLLACYNGGNCNFVDLNTAKVVNTCTTSSCTSKCQCAQGWSGNDCKIKQENVNELQLMQQSPLSRLYQVASATNSPDILNDVVTTTASVLMSNNYLSLSSSSINIGSKIVESTMAKALKLPDMSVENMYSYTASVDGIIASTSFTNVSKPLVNKLYQNYVDGIALLAIRDNVNVSISSPNMAVKVQPMTSTVAITSLSGSRQFEVSMLRKSIKTRLGIRNRRLSSSSNIMVSITRASLYKNSSQSDSVKHSRDISSNTIRVLTNCTSSDYDKTQIFLPTFGSQTYGIIHAINSTSLRTHCSYGEILTEIFDCVYKDKKVVKVTHRCDGNMNTTLITPCPTRTAYPTCNILVGNNCTMTNYTKNDITCICDICGHHNRRLDASLMTSSPLLNNVAVLQISALVEFVLVDYITTMEEAKELKPEDMKRTWIVYISFIVVWIGLALSVFIRNTVYNTFDKMSILSILKLKKDSDSTIHKVNPDVGDDMVSIKKKLHDYINSFVPDIYNDNITSSFARYLKQWMRCHSLKDILSNNDSDSLITKYLKAFRVATHISAYMFFLALLFNLQFPSNDDSCHKYITKSTCLERTNFNADTYCEWVTDSEDHYICVFNKAEFSVMTVLLIAWLQLLLTAPIDAFIDFMFSNFILAPTRFAIEDQKKLLDEAMKIDQSSSGSGSGGSDGTGSGSSSQISPVSYDTNNIITTTNEIKSTIIVPKDFVHRRYKMIVDFLSDHHHHHHHLSGKHTMMNMSMLDESEIIYKLYQQFSNALVKHRQSLSFTNRVTFDEAWEPFFDDEHIESNTIDNDTNANVIMRKYKKTSTIIVTEINLVNKLGEDYCKEFEQMPSQVIIIIIITFTFIIIIIIIIIIIVAWYQPHEAILSRSIRQRYYRG